MNTTLETLTDAAKTALPDATARIDKAADLVTSREVWPLTSGSFLVGAQSDTQAAYLVTRIHGWHCDCPDATYRKGYCKHQIAAMITVKLGTTYQPSYN